LFLGDRIVLLEEGRPIADLAVAHFSSSQHPLVRAYVEAFSGSPDPA
jgi:hypothetical protein